MNSPVETTTKKLISQIQAISDNTHTSFSAFAFASATAARDHSMLFSYFGEDIHYEYDDVKAKRLGVAYKAGALLVQ